MNPWNGQWALYLLALAILVASHGVLSAPALKQQGMARLGRGKFHALYSLVSMAALAGFIITYRATPMGAQLFVPHQSLRWLIVIAMPVLVFLVLARLTTPWSAEGAYLPPRGVYRITRAPGSLAIALWALLHLANTGDMRRVLMFAGLGLIALIAIIKHERILAHATGEGAEVWRSRTSLVPFMARRDDNALPLRADIPLWQIVFAVLITLALLLAHPLLIGPAPLAYLQ